MVGSGQWMRNRSHPLHPQLRQALVRRAEGVVTTVERVVQLARDEHLVASEAGCREGVADTLLVPVHLGGVDVAVADVEGGQHRVARLLGRDLEHPEAELGDPDAVGDRDLRNGCHVPASSGSMRATGETIGRS